MGSLKASAKLRWKGHLGQIEGRSGALSLATATQAELGGPGGKSNPEELFSAALANCFTSTLTGMARARGPLAEIETSVTTRLAWGDGRGHHLSDATCTPCRDTGARGRRQRKLIADAGPTARLPGDLGPDRPARHRGRRARRMRIVLYSIRPRRTP